MKVILFDEPRIGMVISEEKAGSFQLGCKERIQVWIIPQFHDILVMEYTRRRSKCQGPVPGIVI
jgi:hypothetical protein